jgi:hypothetical protein
MSTNWRRFAAGVAALTFLVVLVLSLLVLLWPVKKHWDTVWNDDPFSTRTTTTSVTKVTGAKGDSPSKVTTRGGGAASKTVTTQRGRATEVTTTRQPGEASVVERTLGEGGLLIGRVALAVLAAFLAGAIAQRVALGHYAVKIGTLELGELPAVAGDLKTALEEVTKSTADLKEGLDEEGARGQETADNLKRLAETTASAVAALQTEIARLEARLPPAPR